MSSVAGEPWLKEYMQKLTDEDVEKMKGPIRSNKVFKFGDNCVLRSKVKYMIPMKVAGKSWTILGCCKVRYIITDVKGYDEEAVNGY